MQLNNNKDKVVWGQDSFIQNYKHYYFFIPEISEQKSFYNEEQNTTTMFKNRLENRIKAISLLIKKAAVYIIPNNNKERETRDKFLKKQENFMEITKLY